MTQREAFPWVAAMEAGLGALRLSPRDFWAMTPRELDAALKGAFGSRSAIAPPTRGDLAALMKRYPDGAHHAG